MKTSSYIQTRICDDSREIESIWFPGDDAVGWSTTSKAHHCDKIIPYLETGPHGQMAYYAVYRDGEVYARVPAYMVFAYYKEAQK